MKNLWKWILGILIVLVVAAGLFGLGFVLRNRMATNFAYRVAIRTPGPTPTPGGPAIDKFQDRFRPEPFRAGPRINMQRFGHSGFFNPFMPGFMLFGFLGRLIPLAILLLLLYIAYQLGRRKAVPAAPAAAASPAPPPDVPTTPCPKCESPVQAGWKHCPNCGEELPAD